MSPKTRTVDARLPLALLRAVRRQDTPPELLPDENLDFLYPQRLGLSSVIDKQIRQFKRLARLRRRVGEDRVEALLALVARRSDAGAVFEAAGRELAGLHFSGLGAYRRLSRRLPAGLRRRAALHALRAAHGALFVAADLSVEPSTLEIRASNALTARVGVQGSACTLYGALAAELLELSGLGAHGAAHPECERRGDPRCVWRVERLAQGHERPSAESQVSAANQVAPVGGS
jgi:hypothetical protein